MDYAIRTLSQLRPILQGFRKAAGLTQAAMAAHLGVTQQTYAQLEANPSAVSVERLFRVLRVLQVDLKLSQSGSAHSVAMEDTGAPAAGAPAAGAPAATTANAKRTTRVPPQQGTSAQKPTRAQEPAQRTATAATAATREASGSAAAKAPRSTSAAPKPKAVKLAKATKAASTSKKREDW
ncbi:XRE family transcriptional regulator [Paraburkholderia monticola]|uniref:XRE family transcriptional regulator n=1 Tax=Paraburkholderia monticola TaxID=1399968 RepID=A0A149PG63_9BURK|nr:helix-turn-helix transcriptional regulator [Paraburkholderia monticola]KXU83992.1 XRE family transcriptional regulator [Paraburkholderia monticola]